MRKKALIIISAVLIVAMAVGGTMAFLKAQTGMVKNTFGAASDPTITVEETLNGSTKSDVKVTLDNSATGSYYIRAEIVVNELDEDGNVIAGSTVATSATSAIDGSINSEWTKVGGYYYYKGTVTKGQSTANLFDSFTTENNLQIDILAQAVQANPEDAVEEAWGMSYNKTAGTWSQAK